MITIFVLLAKRESQSKKYWNLVQTNNVFYLIDLSMIDLPVSIENTVHLHFCVLKHTLSLFSLVNAMHFITNLRK